MSVQIPEPCWGCGRIDGAHTCWDGMPCEYAGGASQLFDARTGQLVPWPEEDEEDMSDTLSNRAADELCRSLTGQTVTVEGYTHRDENGILRQTKFLVVGIAPEKFGHGIVTLQNRIDGQFDVAPVDWVNPF